MYFFLHWIFCQYYVRMKKKMEKKLKRKGIPERKAEGHLFLKWNRVICVAHNANVANNRYYHILFVDLQIFRNCFRSIANKPLGWYTVTQKHIRECAAEVAFIKIILKINIKHLPNFWISDIHEVFPFSFFLFFLPFFFYCIN